MRCWTAAAIRKMPYKRFLSPNESSCREGRRADGWMRAERKRWGGRRENNNGKEAFYDGMLRLIACLGLARKPQARPGLPKRGASISTVGQGSASSLAMGSHIWALRLTNIISTYIVLAQYQNTYHIVITSAVFGLSRTVGLTTILRDETWR